MRTIKMTVLIVLLFGPLAFAHIPGDLDNDGNVDRNDVRIILSYRNQPANSCPLCDIDKDGTVTVLDARRAVVMCTWSRCAEQVDLMTGAVPPPDIVPETTQMEYATEDGTVVSTETIEGRVVILFDYNVPVSIAENIILNKGVSVLTTFRTLSEVH